MSDIELPEVAPDEAQKGNERGDSPTETTVEGAEEVKGEEAAEEPPKGEEVTEEPPEGEEEAAEPPKVEEDVYHPPVDDAELSVSNIVPSEFGDETDEEEPVNEEIALEPVDGEEGVTFTPKEGGDGGDELYLAPVDDEGEEKAEEGEREREEEEGEGEEAEEGEGEEEGEDEGEGEGEEQQVEDPEPPRAAGELIDWEVTHKKTEQKMRVRRADSIDDGIEKPAEVGDFLVRAGSSTEAFVFDPVVVSSSSSEEEEVEEEEPVEVEEEELVIDREFYIETYRQLMQERVLLKRKNGLLQKKMVEHYKKRKMENVYKDVLPNAADMEPKYAKKLQAYDEMRTIEEKERFLVNTDLQDMMNQRDALAAVLKQELDALVQKERDTGTGLINSKTGKPIPDKVVERFLKRQQNKCKDIAKCRLAFIKLRDKVNEKEMALKDLETLGDNLHLIDYEQLRMENQNLADKIEERDDELTRLRFRTTQCIQILAHIREKSHATLADIESQKDDLKDVEEDVIKVREALNGAKRQRDFLREETRRNREEAGLLVKPKLLRDFEESIAQVEIEQNKLENVQRAFAEEAKALELARTSLVEVEGEYRNMKFLATRRNAGRKSMIATEEQRRLFPHFADSHKSVMSKQGDQEEETIFQM